MEAKWERNGEWIKRCAGKKKEKGAQIELQKLNCCLKVNSRKEESSSLRKRKLKFLRRAFFLFRFWCSSSARQMRPKITLVVKWVNNDEPWWWNVVRKHVKNWKLFSFLPDNKRRQFSPVFLAPIFQFISNFRKIQLISPMLFRVLRRELL